jgi:hypothetical protein
MLYEAFFEFGGSDETRTRDLPALRAGRSNQLLDISPLLFSFDLRFPLNGIGSIWVFFLVHEFPETFSFCIQASALVVPLQT